MNIKFKNIKLSIVVVYSVLSVMLNAQTTSTIPAVAVLDFEARGLPIYEAETLTDRLRTEIATTKAVQLVDRKLLQNILEEQGLQQSGCTTDECAAEVGQLLGVQYMINGAVGKLGETYSIDAKMVSVTTGVAVRSKSVSYEGEISGLLNEMEILAWEIVGLPVPQRLLVKRGGDVALDKITVAVLDFDPRGISTLEAQTLTDRFAAELNNTEQVILVDRRAMNEVLDEQGFEAQGCTSEECAAEVGALLGVKYMVNGSVGKIGDTFTIDAKMFFVATGVAERTRSKTYAGPVDGLITEIELLAWDLMELDPPRRLTNKQIGGISQPKQRTRFGALMRSTMVPGLGQFYSDKKLWGWIWIGSEALIGTVAYMKFSEYQKANSEYISLLDQYNLSENPTEIADLKIQAQDQHAKMNSANDMMTNMLYAVGTVWVTNMIHAYLTGPNPTANNNDHQNIQLVYDPVTHQPKIEFSIQLD
jgi:TolB-like protein